MVSTSFPQPASLTRQRTLPTHPIQSDSFPAPQPSPSPGRPGPDSEGQRGYTGGAGSATAALGDDGRVSGAGDGAAFSEYDGAGYDGDQPWHYAGYDGDERDADADDAAVQGEQLESRLGRRQERHGN